MSLVTILTGIGSTLVSAIVAITVALIKRDSYRMHSVVSGMQGKLDGLMLTASRTEARLDEIAKTVDHNRDLLIDHIKTHKG